MNPKNNDAEMKMGNAIFGFLRIVRCMVLEEDKLRKELGELTAEHAQLDKKIAAITSERIYDQLLVQRLKRRKLWLKDRIEALHEMLCDDIIA